MGMAMKIMRYDDTITKDWVDDIRTNTTTPYLVDQSNYGTGNWKEKKDPGMANTISIVTGHKYRFSFGKTGINFEDMKIYIDENWLESDKSIFMVHNFSDVRAAIVVTANGINITNDTIPASPADYYLGQNFVGNITDIGSKHEQLFSFIVNGKNNTKWKDNFMNFTGIRCL